MNIFDLPDKQVLGGARCVRSFMRWNSSFLLAMRSVAEVPGPSQMHIYHARILKMQGWTTWKESGSNEEEVLCEMTDNARAIFVTFSRIVEEKLVLTCLLPDTHHLFAEALRMLQAEEGSKTFEVILPTPHTA